MIGILLNLATFVPMVLTVLTLIAKSAFLSGHFALFLTLLNIALKWWSPKWAAESALEHNLQNGFGFGQQNGFDFSQHHHQQNDNNLDPYKGLGNRRVVYLKNRRRRR